MSIDHDPRSAGPDPEPEPEPEIAPARFGRTVAVEWIQPPEPRGGWTDYATLEPRAVQTCLSVGRLVHDDDCVKILAGSAAIVGDEGLRMNGITEIPARCVVRIVRLEEASSW
jgi:hypothetical protein